MTIETRPQTEEMARARRLLKRLAAHDGEISTEAGIDASMAFWTLEGLLPPFPPAGDVSGLPLPSLEEVRDALLAAADAAESVEEALTIARAGAELNTSKAS
ncbi:hypothetical protein ATJ97_0106 [Georgenia soli]|uniref:Uncharacterized protein n=1 Tax=Georgenia soli TaxID=638953 RepID=A0A2A9F225_9MICO|nr:hypothetical protein [Georgenia soli]PFG45053.1 hypothetical protein ATJ97_0106 [Georgenia soli]